MLDYTWHQTINAASTVMAIYIIIIFAMLVISILWKFIDDGEQLKFFTVIEYFGKFIGFTVNPEYDTNPCGEYRYFHSWGKLDNIWPAVLVVGTALSFVILPILFIIIHNIIFFGIVCVILLVAYLARFTVRLYKRFNIHVENIELHNSKKSDNS